MDLHSQPGNEDLRAGTPVEKSTAARRDGRIGGGEVLMAIGWHGRTAAVLVMLTALFAFVYSLAKGAPVGVIAFTSVYLGSVTIGVVGRWRARRNAPSRSSLPSQ